MKLAIMLFAMTLSAAASTLAAGTDDAEAAAKAAALSWLALMDAGRYAESWSAAAPRFRSAIAQTQWQAKAANARGSFGALKSRTVQSASFKRTLPGAPDGEYVVIQFATSFEKKAQAIETVTPMKDDDGSWRVAGYYIR